AVIPGGGTRRRMERAHTLLPHPDSPTIPSTCLSDILKLTESTARAVPASVRKYVFKSFTSRRSEFINLQCRIIFMRSFQAIPTRAMGPPADLATACGRGRRGF